MGVVTASSKWIASAIWPAEPAKGHAPGWPASEALLTKGQGGDLASDQWQRGTDDKLYDVVSRTGKSILFNCGTKGSLERAKWALAKEPGTIAWIDSFEPESTFWDIGANVGVYALYAAIERSCIVTAFEPAASNFAALSRNIVLNGLDRQVRALPVAIDARCKISDMYMVDDNEGSALHVFGSDIDYTGKRFTASHLQGAIGLSIDALVSTFGLAIPNHIKIDVDGLERDVVKGGAATFASPACQSVLVELDLNDAHEVKAISDVLSNCGMNRDETIKANTPRPHPNALVYNMIFRRLG